MNPEDVERLLGRFEPAPPPERLERNVLAEGERIARGEPDHALRPTRRAGRWGLAGVAAACLVLSVILWRILEPHPVPCQGAIELEMHVDTSVAAGPPAFPTGAASLEAYDALFRRADAVKPVSEELRWQRIPWITDLEEAQRLARAERRPLFVWVSSDDPLGRCCGCAAGLRAGPLSQEEVVRRVSASFVPAALDRKVLTRGKGEEFFRSLQRQLQQYHGIWIVSPEGKVLAGHSDRKAKDVEGWSREILETLEAGLKAFGPVEPRTVPPAALLPFRGVGVQSGGSVSLAVHARLMHQGVRDGPVAFDTLTLTASEWALLFPPRGTVGEEWVVPEALARRFSGIVSPVSDPEFVPRPEQSKEAELRATVASIEGDTAILRLSGRWETDHATSEGKRIHASASGEGVAVFDLRKKAMRSFLLVTKGLFGQPPAPGGRESGGVLEWTSGTP